MSDLFAALEWPGDIEIAFAKSKGVLPKMSLAERQAFLAEIVSKGYATWVGVLSMLGFPKDEICKAVIKPLYDYSIARNNSLIPKESTSGLEVSDQAALPGQDRLLKIVESVPEGGISSRK